MLFASIWDSFVGTRFGVATVPLYFNIFLFNICAPRIMALLVPVYFLLIQEVLIEDFVFKMNVSSYSFMEAALTVRFCGI